MERSEFYLKFLDIGVILTRSSGPRIYPVPTRLVLGLSGISIQDGQIRHSAEHHD